MNKLEQQILSEIEKEHGNLVCLPKAAKSCTAIAIDFAKGFSEWLQLNRWFTYDQFKQVWYYTFEQGTPMSEANYLKNYTKTTNQLINLYIESLK